MKTSKRKRSTTATTAEPVVDTASVAAPLAAVMVNETAAAEPVIVLAANCSVKDAAALKSSLCAVAKETTPVTLDARALERIDTATMQLLCAFVRDRLGRNQRVTWQGNSKALRDAAYLLGVRGLLGFEEANGVAA